MYGLVGAQVTIYGSNFVGVTRVMLGAVGAKFTTVNSSQLRATVPSIAKGFYRWQVATTLGASISQGYFRVL
jgi:hypothetical protein